MGLLVAGAVGIVRDVACVACISRGVVCVACIVRRVRRMYCPSRASQVSLFAGGRSQNDCRMQGQIAVGEIAMMNTILISSVILSAASCMGICNIRPFIVTPSPYSGSVKCSPSTAVLSDLRPIPRVSGDRCHLHLIDTFQIERLRLRCYFDDRLLVAKSIARPRGLFVFILIASDKCRGCSIECNYDGGVGRNPEICIAFFRSCPVRCRVL